MPTVSKNRRYPLKKYPVYLGVYVTQETADALRDLAETNEDERSQQWFMRRALKDLLRKHGYEFTRTVTKKVRK